jgi:hypothetical protein
MADNDKGDDKDKGKDKGITLIVNARQHPWEKKKISFEEVVSLAFPTPPPGGQITYTVTYRKADDKKHEGSLTEGNSVTVKDGTTFNVTATDKS